MNTLLTRHMYSQAPARGFARTALILFTLFSAAHASAASIAASVAGLPAGLQVVMSASFTRCLSSGGVTNVSGGSVTLQEEGFSTYELVPMPSGPPRLTQVNHISYSGTLNVSIPNNNCSAIPQGAGVRTYSVVGQRADGTITSRSAVVAMVLNGAGLNVSDTLRASTFRMVRNQAPLTDLAIGTQNRVGASFNDSFGPASVVRPVLEIQRLQAPSGLLIFPTYINVARFFMTSDNQLCLQVSGQALQCRLQSSGGSLTAGAVTLDVSHSVFSAAVSGAARGMTWAFTLSSAFNTAGEFRVVSRADDNDSIDYFVLGQPTSLDLLPWQSLQTPITFTGG